MEPKLFYCLLLFFVINLSPVNGQDNNNFGAVIPTAPLPSQVANLHQFIDIPIGYFSGTTNVIIPLTTINIQDISIPINLNYASLGIKVDQICSSVGTAWNLEAGGMISLNTRGKYDFAGNIGYCTVGTSKLPRPFRGSESLEYETLLELTGAYDGYEGSSPTFDTEPDIYYYSYPGSSGKFVYDRDGKINLIPKKAIRIKLSENGSYLITDENGNEYIYGASGVTYSSYEPYPQPPRSFYTLPNKNITYYLTEIKTVSGLHAKFTYTAEDYTYNYRTEKKTKVFSPSYCGPFYVNPEVVLVEVITIYQRLTKITTNNGQTVEFKYVTPREDTPPTWTYSQAKRLDQIYCISNDSIVKKINFTYNYFNSRDAGSELFKNKRLKLLQVNEEGKPGYTFTYYNENSTSKLNSFSQDIYGYNNGANNASLVPPFPEESGADREVNFNFLVAGTLKTLTYPTGGKSEFEYEIGKGESNNIYIGGLRILTIKEFDSDNTMLKCKKLEYKIPVTDLPSGISNSNPIYTQIITRWAPTRSTEDDECDMCTYNVWESASHSSANISGVSGGNGFYKYVTELIGLNGEGGKTIYEYTTDKDQGNSSIFPGVPEIDYSWARGLLLSSTTIQNLEGVYYLTKKEINTYHWEYNTDPLVNTTWPTESYIGGCIVNIKYPECTKSGPTRPASLDQRNYYHISAWFNLEKKETRSYKLLTSPSDVDNQTKYVSDIKEYEFQEYSNTSINADDFNEYFILKKVKQNTSEYQTLETVISYPFDFNNLDSTSSNEMIKGLYFMRMKNIISKPVEIRKNLDNNTIEGTLLLYNYDGVSKNVNLIESKDLRISTPIPTSSFSPATISQGAFVFDNRYMTRENYKYNSFGNIISNQKFSDVKLSYLWNDEYTLKAIATNADPSEIYYTSYEDSLPLIQAWHPYTLDRRFFRSGCTSLKSYKPSTGEYYYFSPFLDINNSLEKKYKYSCWIYSNGPSAELFFFYKPNSDNDFYSSGWQFDPPKSTDIIGKWVYLEGEVTVPSSMRRIYLRVDNNGGGTVWFDDLRLYPSNSQMKTFTYLPFVGLTSETDEKNSTTFYEYDSLGRLKCVKDLEGNILKHFDYNYKQQ